MKTDKKEFRSFNLERTVKSEIIEIVANHDGFSWDWKTLLLGLSL